MSIGEHIHSPCYHISRNDMNLSVVILEYDGMPPAFPRPASLEELMRVAERSKLSFVCNMLKNENISDLWCYSTFHIDCKPWHNSSAVIIGDAAHAYGPLTAKMANLAINDAFSLSEMLNASTQDNKSQSKILKEWEDIQRPKFLTTRLRTYRHLELYSPRMRGLVTILWKFFPHSMKNYFASIFAYDYEVYEHHKKNAMENKVPGILGISYSDPLKSLKVRILKICVLILVVKISLNCIFFFRLNF